MLILILIEKCRGGKILQTPDRDIFILFLWKQEELVSSVIKNKSLNQAYEKKPLQEKGIIFL